MKRVAVLTLIVIAFAVAPVAVNAQGLFGAGLPSFGGLFGGPAACGDKCEVGPSAGTTFYVGWGDDPNGTTAQFSLESGVAPLGLSQARQKFRVSGLWLGLTQSCPLTDKVAFLASGWYLFPSNHRSSEEYTFGGAAPFPANDWSTKNEWWFVDGILAFGGPNAQLLIGLRYDYLTTKFRDRNIAGPFANSSADVTSQGIIPLFGVQLAQSGANGNLLFRVVGVPALVGTLRYREDVLGFSFEGKGNDNGGYFIEAFGEYGYKMGGAADIGLFARYNTAQGRSDVNFDLAGLNADYRLSLYRSSWTLGAKFALSFNLPTL